MNHRRRRYGFANWLVVAISVVVAVSCSGSGGCGGCSLQEIPGGFPPTKRTANAGQVRLTETAITALTANPAQLVSGILGSGGGSGVIDYSISTCGSTPVCCTNGSATPDCGPIQIDLNLYPGDQPRLQLQPQNVASPNGQVNLTVRARIKTINPLAVTVEGFNCTIALDTTKGSTPDLTITSNVNLNQDGTAGTTDIDPTNFTVSGLESADYTIGGDFECAVADFVPASTIEGLLASPISSALGGAFCKSCTTLADCGSPFATACTGGQCMEGSACFQELGETGRLPATSLFSSFSPTTTGALDLYAIAGGYSTTADSGATGISLGLLAGFEGGGSARDMCGPVATEPAPVTIPRSTWFEGNTYPSGAFAGSAFDIGIGLHKSALTQLAYGGYEGGIFCLTISHNTVSELTTDTVGLLSRSLTHLVESTSPMAVGLRPQSPPIMTLGPNTFSNDGSGNVTLTAPLIDVKFSALELDFFAEVDNQWIRVFTVVSDVDLPVGLEIDGASLKPVLGDVTNAFTNISVKNSEAVTEDPATLAGEFPALLSLVIPQLASALPDVSLPSIGGLDIVVDQVTAVDDQDGDGVGDFLGIFGHFAQAPVAMDIVRTRTTVDVTAVDEPDQTIARTPALWRANQPPRVTLALGAIGHNPGELEYSLRVDDGTWSPWMTNPNPTVSPRLFWLPGVHAVEVLSRVAGHPETADRSPVRISVPIGLGILPPRGTGGLPSAIATDPIHGSEPSGFGCSAQGGLGSAAPFALMLGALLVPMSALRRRRAAKVLRGALRMGPLVWLVAVALLPACNCGSKSKSGSGDCGATPCMTGSLHGSFGRWTSIAGDDQRVMVATYDQIYGDLVVADATSLASGSALDYISVDGVPDETPVYDPSTYRGGVMDPGPNVGAWTSIALSGHVARVAYQDRDTVQLKYAYETGSDTWTSYIVDAGTGGGSGYPQTGSWSKLIIDSEARPAIAYLNLGVDDGMGHRTTELKLARATTPDPQATTDWTITTMTSGIGTCAGMCGAESCIAGSAAQVCVTATTDCATACASSDVCYQGSCDAILPDPMVDDIPTGTGLFASLVVLPDGRLAATYYDRNRKALIIGVETAKDSSQFSETILDGDVTGEDRGEWTSAVVASDGTVHIVYEENLGQQVMYTTWNNGTVGTPETVDDGERMGDRPHPVGQSAQIWLNNGTPEVAYQDGLASDVYTAVRSAPGVWTTTDLAGTALLDGFSIAVTTGHGAAVIAWDSLNVQVTPPHTVVVQSAP